MEGWYYLHTNGDLIYKRELGGTAADIRESPFARALWPFDPRDRAGAWRVLVEALAAGANRERVLSLASRWGCTDTDAEKYAEHIGTRLFRDGDAMCAVTGDFENLMESPVGFGSTALDAFAELAKALGYVPQKLWGNNFADLARKRTGKGE